MSILVRLLAVACIVTCLPGESAPRTNQAAISTEQLIDNLTLLDSQALGIDSFAIFSGFMADDTPSQFEMGLLGAPRPATPPQMRALVQGGITVLPYLIAHLNDHRPTKLKVGNPDDTTASSAMKEQNFFFMFTLFGEEYDPRERSVPPRPIFGGGEHPFSGQYTVKVGDVCYALIGQIVNRRLVPVRYQPTAGLIVNSPIEMPALMDRVKHDWGTATSDDLKASLLLDIHRDRDIYANGAFARLRFYYPDTYTSLSGADLKKKRQFEAAVRAMEKGK
jgi:hypothetical protein